MAKVVDPNTVFTPGSPVNSRELFWGRIDQIDRIERTIPSPGRHPVIFGQRGVGKTSLVNILSELLPDSQTVKSTCQTSDTFKTIWNRVLSSASFSFKERAFGFSPQDAERHVTLADYLNRDNGIHAADVASVLGLIQSTRAVFILDEFDRVGDPHAKRETADLIKNVSDNSPLVTLVLVGVAESIIGLIGEHPSIQRNLVQIEMPVMSDDEIRGVVSRGCTRLGITLGPEVLDEVALLAAGYPHYAHLLGLAIARTSEATGGRTPSLPLFRTVSCGFAVDDAIETFRQAFTAATTTTVPSRYRELLCACAYAKRDLGGWFRTSDVVEAMAARFREVVGSGNIKNSLGKFCDDERGRVLERKKIRSANYYRFADPMMRPFLRIKAHTLGDG